MANTTFNGPVRSENGFQELVDGVWTPLGGGGGGGSVVVLPSDTDSYVLPGDATPGQVITILRGVDDNSPGVTLSITAPIPSGGGGYRFTGVTLYVGMGSPIQFVDNALLEVNTSSPYQFTFVYRGLSSISEATWSITGYGIISNI